MYDERWISVIFLQGERARQVLGLIERNGHTAAVSYLRQWDHGDATTDAALTNGYVYDRIPAGSTDQTIENDGSKYALTYSTTFDYVSLLRRHPHFSESEPVPALSNSRVRQADNWFAAPASSARIPERSVAL